MMSGSAVSPQDNKVQVQAITKLLQDISPSYLKGKQYDKEEAIGWINELGHKVHQALKDLGNPKYKYIVTVDLAENKGEGVRVAAKCSWDPNTDGIVRDVFSNN
ncbi:Tctex-1 [Dimargaris cristalligena]|uniref:Tctex-1 n=1 Tax=Dimargaris cristalligena TaxID=215637 RepID=A0A4P9ZW76_9FUNG|nr:Tctex-1 [Dimargaris cristalligena]|eukprot:RKP37112.1 Tctex-1 [Dimargaris cristalligena]